MAAFDNVVFESWFDYINLTPQKEWNFSYLSANPNITWDIVSANPDKAWDYANLSMNPNITWDIVSANPDIDWNYRCLSMNPMSKHPFFQRQLCYVLK